jgi:electron transport complex protein RnfG
MTQSKPDTFIIKASSRTASILFAFSLVGTALLAYVFGLTHNIIQRNEEQAKLELISETLPKSVYDNDLIKDAIKLPPEKFLGTDDPTLAYRATLKGQFSAVVFEVVAPDGYSGKIRLLVAIRANGEVIGVRVVSHKETPGLGDYIEIAKSPWIKLFEGTTLDKDGDSKWRVKKDGGQFDYVTGATITPRAVVKAVYRSLLYFNENRTELLTGKIAQPIVSPH